MFRPTRHIEAPVFFRGCQHGTLPEREMFLGSFIKKTEFEPGQVAIDRTVAMSIEMNRTSEGEVPSLGLFGSPSWIRTNNLAVNPPEADPLYLRGVP